MPKAVKAYSAFYNSRHNNIQILNFNFKILSYRFPLFVECLIVMEGEIELYPLALKNLSAIVNRHLVRVSVLYSRKNSREKSTKSWEDNGDCSPLHATINRILVRVSLRFKEVDVDNYCETYAVALKSTKKWNFFEEEEKTWKICQALFVLQV